MIPHRTNRARLRWDSAIGGALRPEVTLWEPPQDNVLIGRGTHASLHLPDRSVSVEHVRLSFDLDRVGVHNLSRRGSTRVEGRLLSPGEVVQTTLPVRLQIGRYGWVIEALESTLPVSVTMPIGSLERAPGALVLQDVGGRLAATLSGHPLEVRAACLRFLWVLPSNTGEVVSHDELAEACGRPPRAGEEGNGGGDTHQAARGVRAALETLDDTHGLLPIYLAMVSPAASGGAVVHDLQQSLGKLLVQTVPGKGYRLNLPRDHVHLVRRRHRGQRDRRRP